MIKRQLYRLIQGTFIYGLGNVLNRILSFLLLPLFTHYLSPEDYGISAMLAILTVFLGGVFSLGTGNSMGICYFDTQAKEERPRVVWTTVVLVFVNSAVLSGIGIAFAPQISRLLLQSADYFYLVSLVLASLAVGTASAPFLSYLRLEERAKTFVALSVMRTLLNLSLNIYTVVHLRRGIQGIFEASLITTTVMLMVTALTTWPFLKFGVNVRWIPPLVKIGYPSIFGLGAFFLIDYAGRWMMQRMVGLGEVGVYTIGYNMGLVIYLLVDAFGNAWPPYMISFLHRRREATILFGHVFRYYVLAYGTLTLVFFLFARPVITLMTAEPFHSAFTVVGVISLSYMLKGCYLIMLSGIFFERKLHIQAGIEWVAAIVNVGVNFFLIPLFHKEGAGITTLVSYFTLSVLSYFIGSKLLPIQYDWKSISKFVGGFGILAGSSYINFTGSLFISTATKILGFALFCLYVYYLVLTDSERITALGFVVKAKATLLNIAPTLR